MDTGTGRIHAEVRDLWNEIYCSGNTDDLHDALENADRLLSDPALLPGLWAYARDWDRDVAALRQQARSKRIEQAAWAVRNADTWPFETKLQALYSALEGGQG